MEESDHLRDIMLSFFDQSDIDKLFSSHTLLRKPLSAQQYDRLHGEVQVPIDLLDRLRAADDNPEYERALYPTLCAHSGMTKTPYSIMMLLLEAVYASSPRGQFTRLKHEATGFIAPLCGGDSAATQVTTTLWTEHAI